MLPGKFRLKINQARKEGWPDKKDLYTPAFKLIYRFKEGENQPKIGFIVPGKLGKNARRNRIRRLLAEVVLSRLEKFPPGIEVLVIAGKGATEAKHEELSAFLDQVLPKIYRRR
ncbi:MAG: ribonuclease P protein component [Candidatus Woykebacteria bacterium GWB1_45_5]|uniref:Ribonuclease P protein component n=2 Tax=Candidatus Woykeibacteriota TaxID=1817899 RepID=A0A1G1W4E8_9BACT|nr:MAG: ribonuclease P protein component [Candidatus Woykebacteria bacterium GWB1_45_5]OGY22470.1 MAG: ribonuclease P protein component [Candidatus Woykebacteria bacterium GWA1_44_8]